MSTATSSSSIAPVVSTAIPASNARTTDTGQMWSTHARIGIQTAAAGPRRRWLVAAPTLGSLGERALFLDGSARRDLTDVRTAVSEAWNSHRRGAYAVASAFEKFRFTGGRAVAAASVSRKREGSPLTPTQPPRARAKPDDEVSKCDPSVRQHPYIAPAPARFARGTHRLCEACDTARVPCVHHPELP